MNENTYAETCANEEMGVSGVSPYLAFGKTYAQISNMPVGLVQTSLGGSPMARWNPENGDLYSKYDR
ncbi:MAG: sialate O-acetylesterase [Blautia faecis]